VLDGGILGAFNAVKTHAHIRGLDRHDSRHGGVSEIAGSGVIFGDVNQDVPGGLCDLSPLPGEPLPTRADRRVRVALRSINEGH
jgi:hypothetical protein